MADQETLDAIQTAALIVQVDAGRAPGDPFKLPAAMLTLINTRLSDTKGKNAAADMMAASTVGASELSTEAQAKLNALHHNGYNFIGSLMSDDISDSDRDIVYEAYGWENGAIGDMSSSDRMVELAMDAATATADASVPAAGKYSATLASRIANWLGIYQGAAMIANGGSRQTLIKERNDSRDVLEQANSRVRLFYCSASDDGESTPELGKINMQPKRAPGDAQPQPKPDAPGAATYTAATREASIAAMPAHASFIRAYRQPAGGSAQLAGISAGTTVSTVEFLPATTGVNYTGWIVGVNSRGEGPAGTKFNFTG